MLDRNLSGLHLPLKSVKPFTASWFHSKSFYKYFLHFIVKPVSSSALDCMSYFVIDLLAIHKTTCDLCHVHVFFLFLGDKLFLSEHGLKFFLDLNCFIKANILTVRQHIFKGVS